MFRKLFNKFFPPKEPTLIKDQDKKDIEVVGEDDPHVLAILQACFEHDGPVTGEVNDDGDLVITKHKEEIE